MPNFPYTEERSFIWRNYHETIRNVRVPTYCTVDVLSEQDSPPAFERHGEALCAIVDYCVAANPHKLLRVMGSRWSFSNIVKPTEVLIDPVNLNQMCLVNKDSLTENYINNRYNKGCYRPVFVQSGAEIGFINRKLEHMGLALQTSGASDGQRIAGCIATGTHGAAIGIGAVHDTILGLHIIVGEESGRSLFVHRSTDPCFTSGFAEWLEKVTKITTQDKPDDDLFRAAQVSLGSLGVVHGVILEAAPLYKLRRTVKLRDSSDPDLWEDLRELWTVPDSKNIFSETPYHIEVIFNPHKSNGKKDVYLSLMYKEAPADPGLYSTNPPKEPAFTSDTLDLIGCLSDRLDAPIANILFKLFQPAITNEIRRRYNPDKQGSYFPGQVFGSLSRPLPPKIGVSTELVVDADHAQDAYEVIRGVLTRRARKGEHLLGVVGLRFTKSTEAFLGLNAKEPSCFIDLPSIRNDEVLDLYERIWKELDKCGVDFTCHWGKVGGFDRNRIDRYFGHDRVKKWLKARKRLLTTKVEQQVFASPLLKEAGL